MKILTPLFIENTLYQTESFCYKPNFNYLKDKDKRLNFT